MPSTTETRLSFIAEWFDTNAELTRVFQFSFYPQDNAVEMVDAKYKRTFLKRTPYLALAPEQVYLGACVTIYARALKLVAYADQSTEQECAQQSELTLVAIAGLKTTTIGEVLQQLGATTKVIGLFSVNDSVLPLAVRSKLPHGNAFVAQVRGHVGSTAQSVVLSEQEASQVMQAVRGQTHPVVPNSTLCLIKPHAILSGLTGEIFTDIAATFDISAARTVQLNIEQAEEFLEVYKGVLPEHHLLVHELMAGPVIALQVQSKKGDSSSNALRNWVGPHDPQIAKLVSPESIRARFGHDKVKNAVHCTDLPEDTHLEIDYMFRLLDV